ncbi:hypothetical protein [Enterococcus wangshanyuanii]|uniref:Uncharacterized protein n=1 Tax=Enterococcus wangshanyuanii TaxID=2005703 RepID=A0ABQ1PJ63_9ENTE|nr:hypothetical protein [Enterococcus wangshanyuanii]GGC98164.1 hypothetical protein GCM10011573_29620 [Enterococcus wangshanyuanii]
MNYWYLSLSKSYPRGKTRQAQLKKEFTLIECFNEAEPKEIDGMKLIYLGFGFFSCDHIQQNYDKHRRRIEHVSSKRI